MEDNNLSVEELLKSLRQTMEKRSNSNVNFKKESGAIFQLKNPIKEELQQEQMLSFFNKIIEKVILDILVKNKDLLEEAIEKVFMNTDGKNIFANVCYDYLKSSKDFELILRSTIEKKLASILK